MLGIQPIHIIIVVIVAMLIFGPDKLPQMGRDLGRMISQFRSGADEMTRGFRDEVAKPVEQQIAEPKACVNCNAANASDAVFCSKCGAKFS